MEDSNLIPEPANDFASMLACITAMSDINDEVPDPVTKDIIVPVDEIEL